VDLFQCNYLNISEEIAKATPFKQFDTSVNFVHDVEASARYKKKMYRVLESFRFYVGDPANNTWVYVPKGFLTDLASVPKMFEWLIPHDGPYAVAAIVHDILCEQVTVFKNGQPVYVSFYECHQIFKEAMTVLGVNWFTKNLLYYAVRVYFWWNGYKVSKDLIGKTNDAIEYKWGA
jgi:hypothetical protein